jgi:acetyltransferase-like isoleucine patch superfamily enzyme
VFIGLDAKIGNNCKIQAFAYIPDNVIIGNNVFIGPGVVFTNDKYPPSNGKWKDDEPTIVGDFVSIGANATILPSVVIGIGAKVGAGSVVTKNVKAGVTVAGNPAKEI